ncbi:MAG: hypothetical protein DSY32_00615 [Aquifex sp.]|nr:MAG: hypothetical protein DSY32_00615 [Aquifex sp.]
MKKVLPFLLVVPLIAIPIFYLFNKKEYEIYTVKREKVEKTVYATGYVKALNEVEIKAKVAGYVLEVYKDVGESVRKGEPLARIENKPLEGKIKILETQLKNLEEKIESNSPFVRAYELKIRALREEVKELEEKLRRRKRLYEKELISKEEYETLRRKYRAKLESLKALENEFKERVEDIRRRIREVKANLEEAKEELKEYTVRSPIDGVILKKNVEIGEYVNTFMETKPLFVVGSLKRLKTYLEVDEEYSNLVKVGQEVYVSVESLKNKLFKGKVVKVHRKVDEKKKVFLVEADVKYTERVFPGTTVEGYIVVYRGKALLIPLRAVSEGSKVKVIKNGKVREVKVKLGETYGKKVEVVKGLKEGDKVVIEK